MQRRDCFSPSACCTDLSREVHDSNRIIIAVARRGQRKEVKSSVFSEESFLEMTSSSPD